MTDDEWRDEIVMSVAQIGEFCESHVDREKSPALLISRLCYDKYSSSCVQQRANHNAREKMK